MAKTFFIGKCKLEISDDLEAYNSFRNTFVPLADEAAQQFEKIYKDENHSLGGLVKNFDKQVMTAITPVMKHCSKLLFENGIYDVNTDNFLNQYCTRYITVIDSFQKFVDKYYEIQGNREAARRYREERKASRGMFVGGGFGLEGAAKGMATAGALNVATGFMHSIANGIGNMFSNMDCRKKMDAIFHDRNTLEELKDAVWESAFHMHYAYLDVLEERIGKRINKFEKEAYQKAEAICKNIAELQPDFDTVQPAICQMLLAHPYEFNFYCLIIAQYGDENNQLQQIGEFFHIDIDAIKLYIYDMIIKKIDFTLDVDMEKVISNAESYGVHFGVKQNVIAETSDRIRNSYNEYRLKNTYYEKRKVYLEDTSARKQLDEVLDSCELTCKSAADELYDTYLNGSEGILVPKLIRNDAKLSKYKNYLFMISEDKLNQSFKFKISRNLIEYGRGKCIRVSDVSKIKVEHSKITINDIYHYQCSRPLQDNKLEEYLRKLIEKIQLANKDVICAALDLDSLFSEAGKSSLQQVNTYLKENAKAIVKLYSDYNVYHGLDENKLIAINNIARKLECYGIERKNLNPILWFNIAHVNKVTEDSVIAAEEFNEEKYRVDSEDYVLLTTDYLYFTNYNVKLEVNKLSGFIVNGRNIELQVGDSIVQIAACKYSNPVKLKELLVNIIELLKGNTADPIVLESGNQALEEALEECSNKLNQMLIRRTKENEREEFLRFLVINYENEYFDSEIARYFEEYPIGRYIKAEDVLFYIKNTEPKSKEAIFFTKDKTVIAWVDQSGAVKIDASRTLSDAKYFDLETGKIDAMGRHGKKLAFHIYLNDEGEYVPCYETDFSIEYKRKSICIDIANEVLWRLQELLGITPMRSNLNSYDYFAVQYKKCGLYSKENDKLMFLKYLSEGFDEKFQLAKGSIAQGVFHEEPIFIFDDSLLHNVSVGFVLTNKNLYHKELPNKRISIEHIEEVQFKSGFLKAITIITKAGEKYDLSYNTSLDSKSGLVDFLTTVIFYLKDHPDLINEGKEVKEKENLDYKKAEEAFQAYRNIPGVYIEEEKSIVAAAKRKCDEEGLTTGKQNTLIYRGISNNFDFCFRKMIASGFYYKIDNIEVPLLLFFKGSDFSGGFIITSEAIYTSSGFIAKGMRIPFKLVSTIDLEEGITNSSIFVKMNSYETYNLCKVPIAEGKKYCSIIRSFINEMIAISDKISESAEKLGLEILKLKEACEAIDHLAKEQLEELLEKIKVYPEAFEAELGSITNRLGIIELETKLSTTCPEEDRMGKPEILTLLKELEQKNLPSKTVKEYEKRLNKRLVQIALEELDALCNSIETMDKPALLQLLDKINSEYATVGVRYKHITKINARISELDKIEIKSLCEGIDELSIEECIALKEKLLPYDRAYTRDYIAKLDLKIPAQKPVEVNHSPIQPQPTMNVTRKYCSKCGKPYNIGQRFCMGCGNRLEDIVASPGPTPAVATATKQNEAMPANQSEVITAANITQYCYNALMRTRINRVIGYISIPSYMPKFDKKYANARKAYANIMDEFPILLFDTTIFESGKEGFIITNKHIHGKYLIGKPFQFPLQNVKSFKIFYEGNSIYIGIEHTNGTHQYVLGSNSNEEEAWDRCQYLNQVLSWTKGLN